MSRQNYDLIDTADGKVLASVRYLWPEEPVECCMCGRPTLDHYAVAYYCGPVRSGKSEGGYLPACRSCHDRWARWDDAMEEYDSWLALLRAAGVAPSQAPSEREQALAGLVKRLARRLHPEDNLRVTATEYLKEQGFFNPLRTSGVDVHGEGKKHG